LLVAAFLPPHLYLSQYVTNEPLAGFLVTVAIYFCLRVLRAEQEGLWMPIGIGVTLGAAMLTKFSVLLALLLFPAALSLRLVTRKAHAGKDWLRTVGAVVLACLIVCGWHYGRVWAHFGKPIVLNQGASGLGHSWWQDPGFRTCAFYSNFGRALITPLFSAFHSFADGLYSTLWGDGLASGVSDRGLQPPWNYDLMGAGYWISLGVSLLLIVGAALTLARLIGQIRAEWLLILGMVFLFGLGLLWNTLQAPYCGSVKAFYAFPALLPFSALVAVGCDWLRQRHRAVGVAVWVLLLVWSMTVYTAFWARSGNPETQALRSIECNNLGAAFANKGQTDEAIRQYEEAIRLKPDYTNARYNLGVAFYQLGRIDEAIRQFQEVIRLKPDHAEARNNLGSAFGRKGQTDEAIRQFQEALRFKPDYADARRNLDAVLAVKGNFGKQAGTSTNR
jgi:tetratricopeptide (TPR) repeat protein